MQKYISFNSYNHADRSWPEKEITSAPRWCSVDLRDGNQALITPMTLLEKLELFKLLVDIGFKEIEVGFPSAAEVEFDFVRHLIEEDLIPDDVTIQVLTPARKHLIKRTIESIQGAENVIVHLYNSTSASQRKYVFNMNKEEIKAMALQGAAWIQQYTQAFTGNLTLEYSPESFTDTELDYAIEVCNSVIEAWNEFPIIINLPATVERCTPNVYADMIELSSKQLLHRDKVILSVHTHNDRGTGTAATELALLAGADRVEGTLFGNGERAGNLDIVTVALNMYSQGVDPKLNFRNIPEIISVTNRLTKLPVPERHPYAGSLVFTTFSGSHQDAIKKGMAGYESLGGTWDVPYLSIDPKDIGRTYEEIIHINSQSGKSGVAYIMEKKFHCFLPKAMHPEFGRAVQLIAEKTGNEVTASQIWERFAEEYLDRNQPIHFSSCEITPKQGDNVACRIMLEYNNEEKTVLGEGNGPIQAANAALRTLPVADFTVISYQEHALSPGSQSKAISYIQIKYKGKPRFGVGIDHNIAIASVKALISALNYFL